jgi:hypothetical protein
MKNIFSKIVAIIIITIVLLYINMPVFQFGFYGLPIALIFICALPILFSKANITNILKIDLNQQKLRLNFPFQFAKWQKWGIIIAVLYMTVFAFLSTTPILHSNAYKNLIGDVKQGEKLSMQLSPISLEKIRVVDENLAELLGDKVLGAQPALGSQVNLGKFNIQKVGDQLYWVAPLVHSGFFKWLNNISGSNGYVMVNATNERDVKLVQNIAGKDIKVKYQFESYFNNFLPRHLYAHGFFNIGLTDYTFEIDDAGKPFWVVTLFKKRIGFAGEDAVGIAVVDAQTGDINKYDIANAPAWVDRIQPDYLIHNQLADWGEYINGYWNFSNAGKLQPTAHPLLVYGDDNQSYWYSGLTSVGKDEATVGFALVNTRTKEAKWYKQGGATAEAACQSAMGKVQEKGYNATLPIPYNVNNIPTYVTTLKDNGGLVKMYAMVAIEDYTIVGVGNTLQEALMNYKSGYNRLGNTLKTDSNSKAIILQSTITRINEDIKNGNSYYYFKLKGIEKIFIGSSQMSNELPITMAGDSVKISFDNSTQELIDVSSFQNLGIGK